MVVRVSHLDYLTVDPQTGCNKTFSPLPMHLDEIDAGLISALREDGRMAFRDLGLRVGLSGDAVRDRLRRLSAAEILRVAGRVNPIAVSYGTMAMVLLKIDGPTQTLADSLARIDEIDLVATLLGSSELLIEFVCRDDRELERLLDEHVRSHAMVRDVSVFLYLDVVKDITGGALSQAGGAGQKRDFDDTDRAVLKALQHDGRASYQEIANRTGISYGNARRRTMALIDSGAVRIETTVNRLSEGRVGALIGISTDGSLAPIRNALRAMDEVEFAMVTTGPFDLVLDVACRDRAHLVELVFERLRAIPGVSGTETFVYTQLRKLPLWWFGLVGQPDAEVITRRPA